MTYSLLLKNEIQKSASIVQDSIQAAWRKAIPGILVRSGLAGAGIGAGIGAGFGGEGNRLTGALIGGGVGGVLGAGGGYGVKSLQMRKYMKIVADEEAKLAKVLATPVAKLGT